MIMGINQATHFVITSVHCNLCLLLLTLCRKIHTRSTRHPAHLSWLDDDDRIDATVPVIFGGGVGRIVQSDTIDEELVSVFAGR